MKLKNVVKRFLLVLPAWRICDRLSAYIYFWIAQRRFPSRDSGLFNDYLFFLKTSPEMDTALRQFVSDKNLVKLFYRGVLMGETAPRTLAIVRSFAEFDEEKLPARCVIKPTHLSGCIYFNREIRNLSSEELSVIKSWFRTNMYYDLSRERNYRSLAPMVICEEEIADRERVRDYKIFCYAGEPRVIQVDIGRHTEHRRRLYTADWEALPFSYNKPLAEIEDRPAMLGEALDLACSIAEYFSFIRVDVYLTPDRVYLGELTSVPENAHGRFETEAAEKNFMDLLTGLRR